MHLPRIGVFHPGTQHSWETARALQNEKLLKWYVTSLFYQPHRFPYTMTKYAPSRLKAKIEAECKRFFHPGLDPRLVRTSGAYELLVRLIGRAGLCQFSYGLNLASNNFLSTRVASLLSVDPVDLIWGYDRCSLEAFRKAEELGVRRVLDRTIGDPRVSNEVMAEVYEDCPEFFNGSRQQIPKYIIDNEDHESDLANVIVVGSEFCKQTILLKRPDIASKIQVIPYCFDEIFFPAPPVIPPVQRPIRFIFIGQANPRKGIHLILRAFSQIPSSAASLTIVGNIQIPKQMFAHFASRVQVVPTVRREEVSRYLSKADCLLLPSYFEGSAISVYEALASGLGVIQSARTGVNIDSTVGYTLARLDVEELTRAIMSVIENPSRLDIWRSNARKFVESFDFATYSTNVRKIVYSAIAGS
jgi:glycosyltransferase involved in cell wall biosynthesis